jgi:transposase
MVSLFASRPRKQPQETARSLPPDMRQLIVDLRVELPTMSLREIAEICEVRFDRRPSHNSVKLVLASGPPPSITSRRYQTWDQNPEPAERRLAAIRLHSEGWSVASIAEYLATARQTIYTTLKRWVEEGVKGLDDKSHARKAPRVVTLEIANEIRKKSATCSSMVHSRSGNAVRIMATMSIRARTRVRAKSYHNEALF